MPDTPGSLVLIGLRASGKTTLGRSLAERTGKPFIDLDAVTPRLLGADTVAAAWERHGQSAFRTAELTALLDALAIEGGVIAAGGGTPTAPGVADLLIAERDARRALVVYLSASAAELRRRMRGAGHERPSLTGADPLSEIEAVHARRDPLYRDLASHVVETEGLGVEAALRELMALLPEG
jgi:shikimate kinase